MERSGIQRGPSPAGFYVVHFNANVELCRKALFKLKINQDLYPSTYFIKLVTTPLCPRWREKFNESLYTRMKRIRRKHKPPRPDTKQPNSSPTMGPKKFCTGAFVVMPPALLKKRRPGVAKSIFGGNRCQFWAQIGTMGSYPKKFAKRIIGTKLMEPTWCLSFFIFPPLKEELL